MSGNQLRFYNTLTREKEEFSPIDRENVRMYVCGPTVYDFAHIGNARPAIVFDVLFRLLRHTYGEDHVTYVRNITDVDDKINARALKRFGSEIEAGSMTLNQAIREVTEVTANQYFGDVTALGCLEPTHQPRATEFVLPRDDGKADMTGLIQTLLDKGHAYVATGGEGREVLFDVASMSAYGGLSKRKLEDQQAGARIEVKDHKRNPGDFVLWKESSATEPGWDGIFNVGGDAETIHGRPGWHIECSAMSEAYLGKVFDIHGGGLDLIFPHHENEIAQSRCAYGSEAMANVWMHNGFLQVEGRKMSKSEGNFITINDLLSGVGRRPRAGAVVRLLMLASDYRQPIDFTESKLDYWYSKLSGWVDAFALYRDNEFEYSLHTGASVSPSPEVLAALADNLNFAPVIAHLDKLARYAVRNDHSAANALGSNLIWLGLLEFGKEPLFRSGLSGKGGVGGLLFKYRDAIIDARMLAANRYGYLALKSVDQRNEQIKELEAEFLRRFPEMVADGVMLSLSEHCDIDLVSVDEDIDAEAEIDQKITERLALIAEKNWAEADKIRDDLLAQGIQLKDSKDSETGERITTWEVKR